MQQLLLYQFVTYDVFQKPNKKILSLFFKDSLIQALMDKF